ncbi:ThuA domain-containing protein [Pinibacter soli]|uniref:ThuA domain-containing protein n=1 Tax=Pinibacter soli TaxID=3044211 RepID=A0ABT6RBJ4_9BACT|nr:ThuA domain-containing protein [Pinibacter soli]MDI3319770.1 ThuA domain-containing protein [Pinibacter soli]
MNKTCILLILILIAFGKLHAQNVSSKRFHAIVLYENKGHHVAFSNAARLWLDKLAADSNFAIDYINKTDSIDDNFLSHYQLFIQLDYPPYAWTKTAEQAFIKYIELGKGGWIGFHHATLLGEFDGYPMWQWFSDFMGGIKFKNYIPDFADGKVIVEDVKHPCMKALPKEFVINKEEWYTYDKSPRSSVRVLASVDESTYTPSTDKKMGDHPVVWTNPKFAARNIYIFMGHAPELFDNTAYTTLFRNAIFWAAGW